jgi:hypothetical protein
MRRQSDADTWWFKWICGKIRGLEVTILKRDIPGSSAIRKSKHMNMYQIVTLVYLWLQQKLAEQG